MVSSPLSLRLLQQQATSSHHWVETPESTSCCQEKTRGSVVILNRWLCPRSHWRCSNKWHQHEHVRNVFTGRTRHLAHYVARRKSVLEPSVAPRVSTFNATSGCRSQEKTFFLRDIRTFPSMFLSMYQDIFLPSLWQEILVFLTRSQDVFGSPDLFQLLVLIKLCVILTRHEEMSTRLRTGGI